MGCFSVVRKVTYGKLFTYWRNKLHTHTIICSFRTCIACLWPVPDKMVAIDMVIWSRIYRHIYSPGLVEKPLRSTHLFLHLHFLLIWFWSSQNNLVIVPRSSAILFYLFQFFYTITTIAFFFQWSCHPITSPKWPLIFIFTFYFAKTNSLKLICQTNHAGVIFCIVISIAGVTRAVYSFSSPDLSVRESHGKGIHQGSLEPIKSFYLLYSKKYPSLDQLFEGT